MMMAAVCTCEVVAAGTRVALLALCGKGKWDCVV